MDQTMVKAYLHRIGYTGELSLNLSVLTNLQRKHLLAVPFENLDIHYNTEIILDHDRIFEKIVSRNRGGFCYELNGLFYQLLKSLGFQLKRISGRVYSSGLKLPHEYDHLAILVNLENQEYLVDVGYKEFAIAPLKLRPNTLLKDERGTFLFDLIEDNSYRISFCSENLMTPEYVFKNIHRQYSEFEEMCHFQQFHQDSHFRKQKLITLPTPEGRVTLTSTKLKVTKYGESIETPIAGEEEFKANLSEHFRITI